MSELKKIGFVGTGIMGSAMAGHLMNAGFEVSVYNRTKSKAQKLIERGATWCDTVSECAKVLKSLGAAQVRVLAFASDFGDAFPKKIPDQSRAMSQL